MRLRLSSRRVGTRGGEGQLPAYHRSEGAWFFFSQAQSERIDRQGRLTIPQAFREYAGLSKEVVVAGVGPRVEIWDAAAWDAQRADSEATVEDFASELGI
jgi:division/cell wall cluster transcriptional repressor MraZ